MGAGGDDAPAAFIAPTSSFPPSALDERARAVLEAQTRRERIFEEALAEARREAEAERAAALEEARAEAARGGRAKEKSKNSALNEESAKLKSDSVALRGKQAASEKRSRRPARRSPSSTAR